MFKFVKKAKPEAAVQSGNVSASANTTKVDYRSSSPSSNKLDAEKQTRRKLLKTSYAVNPKEPSSRLLDNPTQNQQHPPLPPPRSRTQDEAKVSCLLVLPCP